MILFSFSVILWVIMIVLRKWYESKGKGENKDEFASSCHIIDKCFLLYFCVTLFNPLISSILKDPVKLATQILMFFRKILFLFNMNCFFGLPFLTEWFDDQTCCFGYFSIRWWGSRTCSYSKHVALQWTIVYCYQILGKVGSNHVIYILGR